MDIRVANFRRSLNGRLLLHQRLGVMWLASLWLGQIASGLCEWAANSNLRAALSIELGTRCGPPSTIPQTNRFINGLKGGLLADESGLGKKVQVIAFLVYLKDRFATPGPHLIAPWTLLFEP